jgi:hypothetical protein
MESLGAPMPVIRQVRRWSSALLFALSVPVGIRAQLPGAGASQGWAPVMVGIRFGFQNRTSSSILGAQVHIPILPSGLVEVMPNADMTFLRGYKDYEYSVDALWLSGGRHGGLYAGAGPAVRSGIFDGNVGQREHRTGWDIVLGLKTMPGRGIPVGIQLEERWIFMRLPINPSVLTFGVNVPLWPLWGFGHWRD